MPVAGGPRKGFMKDGPLKLSFEGSARGRRTLPKDRDMEMESPIGSGRWAPGLQNIKGRDVQ